MVRNWKCIKGETKYLEQGVKAAKLYKMTGKIDWWLLTLNQIYLMKKTQREDSPHKENLCISLLIEINIYSDKVTFSRYICLGKRSLYKS